MAYISGIGGANIDIHGRADHALVMCDSNPGTMHYSLGGVCRNICENLARLGCEVHLATVVGDDANGRAILNGCINAGIDMTATRVLHHETSSTYVCLMDEKGDLAMAMSDMHIIKRMDEHFVDEALFDLSGAELVVCDGNLSQAAVEHLTTCMAQPLLCDPVSTAWAKDLRPYVGRFDTLKPNRMELAALTGMPTGTTDEIRTAAKSLIDQGVKRVFVSMGNRGMMLVSREETICEEGRPLPKVVDTTGAGDASMAGIAYATLHGFTPRQTVHFAMGAGMVSAMCEDTINKEISPEAVDRMIKEYIL